MTPSPHVDQPKSKVEPRELSLKSVNSPVRGHSDQYTSIAERLFGSDSPFHVILFASISKGEGVSHIVQAVSERLANRGDHFVAVNGSLSQTTFSLMPPKSRTDREMRLSRSSVGTDDRSPSIARLDSLRASFEHVLVDCGPLQSSLDVTKLCAQSDGVVLVIDTKRTDKVQLARAIEMVNESGGQVIGFILNKYEDPLPAWLRRLFGRGK